MFVPQSYPSHSDRSNDGGRLIPQAAQSERFPSGAASAQWHLLCPQSSRHTPCAVRISQVTAHGMCLLLSKVSAIGRKPPGSTKEGLRPRTGGLTPPRSDVSSRTTRGIYRRRVSVSVDRARYEPNGEPHGCSTARLRCCFRSRTVLVILLGSAALPAALAILG